MTKITLKNDCKAECTFSEGTTNIQPLLTEAFRLGVRKFIEGADLPLQLYQAA